MKCRNCDKEFDDKIKYCPGCGEPVSRRDREDDNDDEGEGILDTITSFIGGLFK